MNERISFLVDRTSEIMPGVYSLIYESGERGVEFSEAALEKFVELIVQECIVVHLNDYQLDIIGSVLKEHFGIES